MAGIEKVISSTMENLKGMIDVNTVVGEAMKVSEDVVVIPVSKVTFGFASGGSEYISGKTAEEDNAFGGGAGGGVTINPMAFLVIEHDHVRLVPVTSALTTVDRIIDAVPELIAKANKLFESYKEKKDNKEEEESVNIVINE